MPIEREVGGGAAAGARGADPRRAGAPGECVARRLVRRRVDELLRQPPASSALAVDRQRGARGDQALPGQMGSTQTGHRHARDPPR